MRWNQTGLSNGSQQTSVKVLPKPIEMYVFIDPLCPECWSLNPYLKKLTLEYGRFFTLIPIISSVFVSSSKRHKRSTYYSDRNDGKFKRPIPVTCPWIVPLAVKAAEIQGKRAGKTFLRKLQQKLFWHHVDVTEESKLYEIAKEAKLAVEEFKEDLYSASAKKAYQCDFKLMQEMEIEHVPTIVFINHFSDEQGIKITGIYPYEVYEHVLQETLQKIPIPSEKPPLEDYFKKYEVVGMEEISFVYDWSRGKTEKELKKLQFQQKVKQINFSLWEYIY